MLSILSRGTVEAGNTTWEFHGDNENDKIFYITPQPQFVMAGSLPKIEIVEYDTKDDQNGSGYVQLQVELGIPDGALEPIRAKIRELYNVTNPIFQTLAVQGGTLVNITYPDGKNGFTGMQVTASDFGSNAAVFQIPMISDQIKEVKTVMGKAGSSPFTVNYEVVVPSFMPAVTCELSFDASIAFEFQVTTHAHHKWAHSTTYTYDISKELTASNASKISIDKVDPNVKQTVVDDVRQWAQSVIEARVADEIKKQLELMEKSGGHQSFSVKQLSSFRETYAQNETIMWRVRPAAILPSFGQLDLTREQISGLEPSVDMRKFVLTLTPNVKFDAAAAPLSIAPKGIAASDNPFITDIKKLKSLEVTVHYPTLSGAKERTFTFTSNEPNVWTADWDDTAGGKYSLSYTATYDDNQQIEGKKECLTDSEYILGLAEVGILNLQFNASKFFADKSKGKPGESLSGVDTVESLIVSVVFEVPNNPPFLKSVTLNDKAPIQTVTSTFNAPVSTYYDYMLTYYFKPETKANPYTSNTRRQNSQLVDINAPDMMQLMPVMVNMGNQSDPDTSFLDVSMNIYYDGTPVFPKIEASKALPVPTQSSPIHFEFVPDTSPSPIQRDKFTIFANSNLTPLTLNATGVTGSGQTVNWGPVNFDPLGLTLLSFFSTNLFTFVEVDPSIVDWKTNPEDSDDELVSISVTVPQATYKTNDKGESSQVTVHTHNATASIAYDPQQKRAPSSFFKVDTLSPHYYDIGFTWNATYVYKKAGSISTSGTISGTKVSLPATPPNPKK